MNRLEKARQTQRKAEEQARIIEQQKLDAEETRKAQVNEIFETSVKSALNKEEGEFVQKHIPPEILNLFEEVVDQIKKEHNVQLSKTISFWYTPIWNHSHSNHKNASFNFEDKEKLVKSWKNNDELVSRVGIKFIDKESKGKFIDLEINKQTNQEHTTWTFGPNSGKYIPNETDISELIEIFAKNLNHQKYLKPAPRKQEREWDGGDSEFGPSR